MPTLSCLYQRLRQLPHPFHKLPLHNMARGGMSHQMDQVQRGALHQVEHRVEHQVKTPGRGQVLVIFVLSLLMLLAFVGLTVDAASLYVTYGQLKRAVDAAAVAAAAARRLTVFQNLLQRLPVHPRLPENLPPAHAPGQYFFSNLSPVFHIAIHASLLMKMPHF